MAARPVQMMIMSRGVGDRVLVIPACRPSG